MGEGVLVLGGSLEGEQEGGLEERLDGRLLEVLHRGTTYTVHIQVRT